MKRVLTRLLRANSKLFIVSLSAGVVTILAVSPVSAAVINLTTVGSSGTINSAIYEQAGPQSTGTGTINTFVQQSPSGNGTNSHAYNTTANNILDNKSSDNFNHSIALSAVPIVVRGNTFYREFLLDTNESSGGGEEFLSLDDVQIFVGGTANSSAPTFTSGVLNHDGTLVYRMDAGGDNWVALNYALNSGSGSGDMFLLVPHSLFTGYSGSSVVTLYSKFGLQGTNPPGFTGVFSSSGGFEEWALREGIDPPPGADIPEPSAILILAASLLGLAAQRGRQRG